MIARKAIVLINLGTPDKPEIRDVRRYLTEFLNDRRVIDIPWLAQKLLVNLIIIPFRVRNSTRLYKKLWTEQGSPLLLHLDNLASKLEQEFPGDGNVFKAMRYGKPSLSETLNRIREQGYEEIILFPLFPQYASSTTGSIAEKTFREINSWQAMPGIRMINQFYHHPGFVEAFARQIDSYDPAGYDHVVFSYHGLPNRQLRKIHPGTDCMGCVCEKELPSYGRLCYKATCYETTRLLAGRLDLPPGKYTVGFQSRLSKDWLSPFTDKLVIDLAKQGAKRILLTAPSFVADCLETIVELEYEYQLLFRNNGGEELTLVKSLNDSDQWVDAIMEILEDLT